MTNPNKILIDKIEFYITNVCNLACDRCNRFNNHQFRGFQDWDKYKDVYKQWANFVDIRQVVILGGEPLLNPSIIDWVKGINDAWHTPVQILSNGTRMNYVRGLYELLLDTHYTNYLSVTWHNALTLTELEQELHQFLKGTVERLPKEHPQNIYGADFVYVDDNGIKIPVWMSDYFSDASVKLSPAGRFSLHQNDPVKAHANCGFVTHKSYHFIRGKLYKCGPVALFPEFDEQHNFDLCAEDKELLTKYQPLSVEDFETKGRQFLQDINKVIPQCKFCPVDPDNKKLISIRKNSEVL